MPDLDQTCFQPCFCEQSLFSAIYFMFCFKLACVSGSLGFTPAPYRRLFTHGNCACGCKMSFTRLKYKIKRLIFVAIQTQLCTVPCSPLFAGAAYLQAGMETGGLVTPGSSFRAKQSCLSVMQTEGLTKSVHARHTFT